MSILGAQTAIVEALAAHEVNGVKLLRRAVAHAGRFELESLQRFTASSPSAAVACLGGRLARSPGGNVLTARWAVFVVAQDAANAARSPTSLVVAEELLSVVAASPWAAHVVRPPSGIELENLYSTATDARGVSLWAISWEQAVAVGDEDPSELVRLLRIGWDLDDPTSVASPDISSLVVYS